MQSDTNLHLHSQRRTLPFFDFIIFGNTTKGRESFFTASEKKVMTEAQIQTNHKTTLETSLTKHFTSPNALKLHWNHPHFRDSSNSHALYKGFDWKHFKESEKLCWIEITQKFNFYCYFGNIKVKIIGTMHHFT